MQRLEVLVAVMLARERRSPADDAADGCTGLAAALATLPSRPLEMVADALAALGIECDVERPFCITCYLEQRGIFRPRLKSSPASITAPGEPTLGSTVLPPSPVTDAHASFFLLPIRGEYDECGRWP